LEYRTNACRVCLQFLYRTDSPKIGQSGTIPDIWQPYKNFVGDLCFSAHGHVHIGEYIGNNSLALFLHVRSTVVQAIHCSTSSAAILCSTFSLPPIISQIEVVCKCSLLDTPAIRLRHPISNTGSLGLAVSFSIYVSLLKSSRLRTSVSYTLTIVLGPVSLELHN